MKKNTVLIALLAGFVAGVVVTLVLPSLARPYLPRSLRGEALPGVVRAKQREGDRLLLTVVTGPGTVLATFTEEVAGIDLLVQVGDSVSLEVTGYEPFLDNPEIGRVSKGPDLPAPVGPPADVRAVPDSMVALPDTAGAPAADSIADTVTADTIR